MSDTTTPTGADGLAGLVAKWRKRVDDLDNKVTRVMSDSEREWLQGKAEGLDEAADELEAALSSVADGVPRDDELPGMWERADLIGGATDCPAAPVGGDGEAVVRHAMDPGIRADAACGGFGCDAEGPCACGGRIDFTRPAAPVGGDGEASAGTFQQWFASEHPETNRLADAGDLAAIGNRYAAREGWNAALATRPAAAGVGEDVSSAMQEAYDDWYDQYGTNGNGHIARSVAEKCHEAFVAAWPKGADAAAEAALDVLTGLNVDQRAAVKFYQQNPTAALQDLRKRLAAAPSPGAGGEWIEVGERLPEVGTDCLVWTHPSYSKGAFAKVDRWDEQHESPVPFSSATIPIGPGWDDSEFDDVTHWQPLPPPPATHHQEQRRHG